MQRLAARDVADVSIHAPAWGATPPGPHRSDAGGFNPRPRVGGDRDRDTVGHVERVSIHAPAWGATWPFSARPGIRGFNPRPPGGTFVGGWRLIRGFVFQFHAPRGGATQEAGWRLWELEFQSTPPRGGRHNDGDCCSRADQGFNPRPRVGGDVSSLSCIS